MPTTGKKYAILEDNGTEFWGPVEHNPVAEDIGFSDPDFNSDNVADAIPETKSIAISLPRFPVICVWNSTMSSGDWVTLSNLTPDTLIGIPVKSKIAEIIITNSRPSADFNLTIRRDGRATTILKTLTVVNANPTVFDLLVDNIVFEQGDTLDMQYVDTGTNAQDLNVVVYMQAVE